MWMTDQEREIHVFHYSVKLNAFEISKNSNYLDSTVVCIRLVHERRFLMPCTKMKAKYSIVKFCTRAGLVNMAPPLFFPDVCV